jgi:signal transduction histidine kinase
MMAIASNTNCRRLPLLRIARLCCAFAVSATSSLLAQQPTNAANEVLTCVSQVRALSPAEAARAIPARIKGVMLGDMLQEPQSLILADDSGALFATEARGKRGLLAKCRRGDLLELTGVTDAGGFAPILNAQSVRKLGTEPIPPARVVSYQQLMSGALDAQWVELRGVVRQFFGRWTNSDISRIVVSLDGGRVPVRFTETSHPGGIAVDSDVHVRALCLYQFNANRQVMSPVLQVPPGEPVVVESSPPTDPFTVPLRRAADLRTFSPDNLHAYAHRVHVRGVVTAGHGNAFVWIRDGSTGLRIQTSAQDDSMKPGDEIEALGFLALASYPPALEDATLRMIATTNPPSPVELTSFNQAFAYQNDLVAMTASLTRIQTMPDGVVLSLESGKQSCEAILKWTSVDPALPEWHPGSLVRVAGICSSAYDDPRPYAGIWQPKSFQILLRSPADVTVLTQPSWWTPQHTMYVLGAVSLGLLLVIGAGVAISRRRFHEQARRREMAEAEFAAILSERNRVAREIHDTLAQGLAATSVQLRLAKKNSAGNPAALNQHLDSAQQLVRDSLQEARNSIWNMRSQVLETGDLTSALRGIVNQMANGSELRTGFDVSGRVRRFAPVVENNLLRVGQEAITNAVKHARAREIKVALDFGEKQFRLSVRDDGCGFDPANPRSNGGGFGLTGMHERARELNGELKVRSGEGSGTEVTLTVPLSGE